MGCPWGQESTSEMASEDEMQLIITCLKCLRSEVLYVSEHLLIIRCLGDGTQVQIGNTSIFSYIPLKAILHACFLDLFPFYFIILKCIIL